MQLMFAPESTKIALERLKTRFASVGATTGHAFSPGSGVNADSQLETLVKRCRGLLRSPDVTMVGIMYLTVVFLGRLLLASLSVI